MLAVERISMRKTAFFVMLTALAAAAMGQERTPLAHPTSNAAAARFDSILHQSLAALSHAGSYAVEVDATWDASGHGNGSHGSHYRLVWQGGKYRVEVQTHGAESLDLVCVNDGSHVTTYFPAR